MPRLTLVAILLTLLAAATGRAQTCTDAHYRWTVKTTTAQQGAAATATTPAAMLTWTPLDLYRQTPDCTPRADHETTLYAVTGWARELRVQKAPGDLDWHIELTQTAKTKSSKCIVVEIPDPQYGSVFAAARQDFLDLIINSTIKNKRIVPPVRVTVTGPAFFDAEHRGARGTTKPPHGHGHCNASSSALWEIHPVYQVTAP
jgi:hypothetical protein